MRVVGALAGALARTGALLVGVSESLLRFGTLAPLRGARRRLLLPEGARDEPAAIRVLVVDDSAFARKVLREVLRGDAGIEVVGIARDGLDALEKIAELEARRRHARPRDADLDGVGVLRALHGDARAPRVVVVSIPTRDSELGVEALRLGAVDLVAQADRARDRPALRARPPSWSAKVQRPRRARACRAPVRPALASAARRRGRAARVHDASS